MFPNRPLQYQQRFPAIMCPKCRDHGFYKVAKIQDPPIAYYNPTINQGTFEAVKVYCSCSIGRRLRIEDRHLNLDFDS